MVNANVIISVSAVVVASIVGIVVWMKMRGATPDTMSLADACTGYFGSDGALPEAASTLNNMNSCDTIKANGWTWDTPIPCAADSDAFYTMRGVFAATDAMITKMNSMSSSAVGGAVPANTQVTDVADYISSQCHAPLTRKLMTPEQRDLSLANSLNSGPCSIALGFSFMSALASSLGSDAAECSGNPLSHGNCYGTVGTTVANRQKIANMFDRNNNAWLHAGCYNHDLCLQKGGNGNAATPYGSGLCNAPINAPGYTDSPWASGTDHSNQNCDKSLGDAAYNCLTAVWWQNCLCTWAGCASCPYQPCPNSNVASTAVWAAIGGIWPNRAFCAV